MVIGRVKYRLHILHGFVHLHADDGYWIIWIEYRLVIIALRIGCIALKPQFVAFGSFCWAKIMRVA